MVVMFVFVDGGLDVDNPTRMPSQLLQCLPSITCLIKDSIGWGLPTDIDIADYLSDVGDEGGEVIRRSKDVRWMESWDDLYSGEAVALLRRSNPFRSDFALSPKNRSSRHVSKGKDGTWISCLDFNLEPRTAGSHFFGSRRTVILRSTEAGVGDEYFTTMKTVVFKNRVEKLS
jgi:hypothetical protein